MICSFKDSRTRKVFRRERVKDFSLQLQRIAQHKLVMLHTVDKLSELRSPPGNRLERLSGDRRGQYSLRINDQWRICFRWKDNAAHEVEITDYH